MISLQISQVLKDAGQEPEDWLQKQADSNFAHVSGLSSSGGFGGRDIRNKRGGYDGGKEELPSGGFGSKFQQDEAEEEESWD